MIDISHFSSFSITIIGDATQLWNKSIPSGYIYGNLIGDINGDTKADAIITYSSGTVSAVRGYDGVELWNRTGLSWPVATSAGDLNGDTKADVIINSGTSQYTATAVRGYDGIELWNKSQLVLPAISAGDLDGENKADALFTRWMSISAVRGYDGVELWNKSISGAQRVTFAGDLDGDNKADAMITCGSSVAAVRGYDGLELWNKTWSGGWCMQATSAGDLDGDNKADAIIFTTSFISAVRGYDGAELWNKSISGENHATFARDLNGDNKADAIITTYSYSSGYHYTVSAVRGYDGVELWNKTIVSNSNTGVSGNSAGDLNKDLRGDVLITNNSWSSNNYTLYAINGIDGSELFRVKANTWLETINATTKRYDLNGDGGDDILVWTSDNIYALSAQSYQGSSIGYSATVATGQNTYVQSSNGTFGVLVKGQTKTINNSVILNNTGDLSAKVEARFNDSIVGIFGLISGANVLNATNFALGIPSVLVPLNNSGADVQVAVAPPGVTAMDARLGVPSNQIAGDYSGMVVLTFSNNV